jgi:hypothetical protein
LMNCLLTTVKSIGITFKKEFVGTEFCQSSSPMPGVLVIKLFTLVVNGRGKVSGATTLRRTTFGIMTFSITLIK